MNDNSKNFDNSINFVADVTLYTREQWRKKSAKVRESSTARWRSIPFQVSRRMPFVRCLVVLYGRRGLKFNELAIAAWREGFYNFDY